VSELRKSGRAEPDETIPGKLVRIKNTTSRVSKSLFLRDAERSEPGNNGSRSDEGERSLDDDEAAMLTAYFRARPSCIKGSRFSTAARFRGVLGHRMQVTASSSPVRFLSVCYRGAAILRDAQLKASLQVL
jgi:hypothetical protein